MFISTMAHSKNCRREDFYQSVQDGDELHVDLAAATVTHNGKTYRGASLPPVMRRIMQSGGLVANVKQELQPAK